MEKDGAGNLAHQYTYGNERITSEGYSKLSGLYLYDGRGSVSDILGTFNEHRTSYEYTSLADVSVQYSKYGYTAQHKSFYGYNAESYSEKTGNIYLRNRFLNTKRQQFLSEDTYIGNVYDPLSLNRYNYAKSNPLKYKDPSGNLPIAGISGAIVGMATGRLEDGINAMIKVSAMKQYARRFSRIMTGNNLLGNLILPNDEPIDGLFSGDIAYYNFLKPSLQEESDKFWKEKSKEFNGGKEIAQFLDDNKTYIENLFNVLSVFKGALQVCGDIVAEPVYNIIDDCTKEFGGIAGFRTVTDRSNNKIVTVNYWTWQGLFGYADVYDLVFNKMTPSNRDKINIGNDYTIWIWKGDYLNLGAGGEMGVYEGVGGAVGSTMSDDLKIEMTMKITDKQGKKIVDIDNRKTIWDKLTGKTNENWWITGFNPHVQGYTDKDLTLEGTINFNGSKKAKEMYRELERTYRAQAGDIRGHMNLQDGVAYYTWEGDDN